MVKCRGRDQRLVLGVEQLEIGRRSAWMGAILVFALASCNLELDGPVEPTGGSSLLVTPSERLDLEGIEGGVVNPASAVYTILNRGESLLVWTASNNTAWLMVEPSGGSLAPGQSQELLVQVEGSSVAALASGQWSGSIQIISLDSSANGRIDVRLTLHPPGELSVFPGSDFNVTGSSGGPFEPASETYTVRNDGESSVTWEVSSQTAWIELSGTSLGGDLAPGESALVLVETEQQVAATLEPGAHQGTIHFSNLSAQTETLIEARLTIENEGDLTILPFEAIQISGQEGGPFSPSETNIRLRNDGLATLEWSAEASSSWVHFYGSVTGLLAPGEEADLMVQPDSNALEGFSVGQYQADLTFRDLTSSEQWTLPMVVTITTPGQLEVNTTGEWNIVGPVGGPFQPPGWTYALGNTGGTALDWVVEFDVPWLTVQGPLGGVAMPASNVNVQVAVIATLASALPAGVHAATIRFRDTTNLDVVERQISLIIDDTPVLVVQPATPIIFSGNEGGPFAPEQAELLIENTGNSAASWVVSSPTAWLQLLGGPGGTLATGESATLPISIGAQAESLPIGLHTATIAFTIVGSNAPFQECEVRLTVEQIQDELGWTVYNPSQDSRVVYVSASLGSDSNDGLSESSPVRNLTVGRALLRSGFPDWMLLRRGDTWHDASLASWNLSGRSSSEPMLVGAYGEETLSRPLVLTPPDSSFISDHFSTTIRYLVFLSMEARPVSRSLDGGGFGIGFVQGRCSDIHFEDLHVSGYGDNVHLRGPATHEQGLGANFSLHRCVIADSYRLPSHGQGLLAVGIDGLTVTECVFDHNGWNLALGVSPNGFKRNVYIQSDCDNVIFSKNHSHRSSSDGLQARAGGTVNRNLMVNNAKGFAFGHRSGGPSKIGGASGEVRENVILDSMDLHGSTGGFGISVGNINTTGCVVENNVIARSNSASGVGYGLLLTSVNNGFGDDSILNLSVRANVVYDTHRPLYINGAPGVNLTNVRIEQNVFETFSTSANPGRAGDMLGTAPTTPADLLLSGNRYYSARAAHQWFRVAGADVSHQVWATQHAESGSSNLAGTWPDPNRSVAGYLDEIGGTTGNTLEDFVAELRLQRKGRWNRDLETTPVINYVRTGFGLGALGDL